jgi:hypothetical protein
MESWIRFGIKTLYSTVLLPVPSVLQYHHRAKEMPILFFVQAVRVPAQGEGQQLSHRIYRCHFQFLHVQVCLLLSHAIAVLLFMLKF